MQKYLLIKNIINASVSSVILILLFYLFDVGNNINVFYLVFTIIFTFISLIAKSIFNSKEWEYNFDKDKIVYQTGFIKRVRVTIPMMRVQQVTTITNPILDKMDLVVVYIITTNDKHKMLPIHTDESKEFISFVTNTLSKDKKGDL